MPRTLEQLRLEFAKRDPIHAGKYGEKFAREWFTKNKWDFVDMEQARDTMHAKLRALGGKRPDFIIDGKSGKRTSPLLMRNLRRPTTASISVCPIGRLRNIGCSRCSQKAKFQARSVKCCS